MPYGITTLKATSNHSRISVVVLIYGLGLGMATLKYQSTNGTVNSLKNEENKKELFSFPSEDIVKKDLGRKLLLIPNVRELFLTDRVMCLLSNHSTTLKQIQ